MQLTSLRILVVDDNQDTALSMAELLEVLGHEAKVAYEGTRALELALDFQPQIVLLDIGLPIEDGYQVARRMRQHAALSETMLVALTGYGRDEDREHARQAGFDMHFTKPIELDDLQLVLEKKLQAVNQ